MAKVLVTRDLPGAAMMQLRRAHEVVLGAAESAAMAGTEALICQLTERVDAALLSSAPALRVVGNFAVGVDNIDVAAATARRIPIVHTPGVLTDATADFTLTLLLAAARRVVEADALVRAGGFTGWAHDLLLGADLTGKQIGIIGPGRIGTAVARRAVGFGLQVVYSARHDHGDLGLGARSVDLAELLSSSDFVTLHLPLSPETRNLLGEPELRSMKREAILVNVARGPLVDEAALARALDQGWIQAAALDVYQHEPAVHPDLLRHPRAVLAPHLGSATVGTRVRMANLVCSGVGAVLRGERPDNVVNPIVWS